MKTKEAVRHRTASHLLLLAAALSFGIAHAQVESVTVSKGYAYIQTGVGTVS